jgi:hypothetical protein
MTTNNFFKTKKVNFGHQKLEFPMKRQSMATLCMRNMIGSLYETSIMFRIQSNVIHSMCIGI